MPKNKYPTLQELIQQYNLTPHLHETIQGVAKSSNGYIHVYVTPNNEYYTAIRPLTQQMVYDLFYDNSFNHYLVRGYVGRF